MSAVKDTFEGEGYAEQTQASIDLMDYQDAFSKLLKELGKAGLGQCVWWASLDGKLELLYLVVLTRQVLLGDNAMLDPRREEIDALSEHTFSAEEGESIVDLEESDRHLMCVVLRAGTSEVLGFNIGELERMAKEPKMAARVASLWALAADPEQFPEYSPMYDIGREMVDAVEEGSVF